MSDSKTDILAVATRLFAQRGYDGTSLQAIAEDVGMRKPSLLYHFPSKMDLWEAVIGDLLERWQTRLPEVLAVATTGQDRFSALFDEVSGFFKADPNRALLIMREVVGRPREARARIGETARPWLRMLADTIREGQAAGHIRKGVDPEAYLVEYVVMIVGSFVAADLASVVFDGARARERVDRQLAEVLRMVHMSLFLPQTS